MLSQVAIRQEMIWNYRLFLHVRQIKYREYNIDSGTTDYEDRQNNEWYEQGSFNIFQSFLD